MKHLLLFLFAFLTALGASAQCDPLTDFEGEQFGVSPDTVENFATGQVGELYLQQIDVKAADNAGFVNPNFSFLTIDSIRFAFITGLPEGFQFACSNTLTTPCSYLGGELGCAVLGGVPQVAGTYELQVGFAVYAGAQAIPYGVEGYRIIIEDDPLSAPEAMNHEFALKQCAPNPAVRYTQLGITAPRSERASLTVFDLAGRTVAVDQRMLHSGENKWRRETVDLENGIYVYRIDAFGESRSGRFVVSR